MTKDKELLLHLERIADALEDALPLLEKIANPQVVINYPPAPPTNPFPPGGYRCGNCGSWVPAGNIHSCAPRTWPSIGPGSPNICRTGSGQSGPYSGPATIVYNGTSYFPIAGTAVGDTAS